MWKANSKDCLECRWCCSSELLTLGDENYGQEEVAHHLWEKGRRVLWEPASKQWFVMFKLPCKYITRWGCVRYDTRPLHCKIWDCTWGPRIQKLARIWEVAGDRIMKEIKRRGRYYGESDSSNSTD